MPDIKRNLEANGGLYVNKFWTGLYTNRSPLFVPVSAMGIQLVSRQDVLSDGQNIQISPQFTLKRRYGFSRYCQEQFGSMSFNEIPKDFFSFENLSGDIDVVTDTNVGVYLINPSTHSCLFDKASGAGQSSFNAVANTLYWCDGISAMKYVGPNLLLESGTFTSTWTITGPTVTSGATDPFGGTGAYTVQYAHTGFNDVISQTVTPNYTPVANNTFTFSIWMKTGTGSNSTNIVVIDQGSNQLGGLAITPTSTWTRYSVTFTALNTSTSLTCYATDANTAMGSGNTVLIYGAQLEANGVASTYQPTTTQPQGVYLMGIIAPTVAPTLSYSSNGQLAPTVGYQYGYCNYNPLTGDLSTMSPASANTGPLANQSVTESSVTVTVTATACTSNIHTITASNNFEPGQKVTFKNLVHATWLNSQTGTVIASGLSTSQFEVSGISHANYSSAAESAGTATMALSVPGSTPYQYTVVNAATFTADGGVVYASTSAELTKVASGPTVGQYSVSAGGVYTFAAADANANIAITYSFSLGYSTGVNITVTGDGTSDPQATEIWVFRTDDGGAQYYFLAEVANPGGASTWTYTDSTPDSGLNVDLIAPVADVNDPPPSGMSLLTWYAGRLWGASGNTLYYSGGPDTLIGVGTEAWPPINNYTLPGNIKALAPTSYGLIIFTVDDAYVLTGTSAATFTVPQVWQSNWGVVNSNCVAQDGDNLFILTSRRQVWNYSANGLNEIGFLIESQLGAISPSGAYIAVHRSGTDEGVFVSDGSTNIWRYSQVANAWDPKIAVVGGVGAIASIELPNNVWTLLIGRATQGGYVLQRDLTTFSDDGTSYPAFVTIGSLIVAPPGQTATIESVLTQFTGIGTYPTVAVMLNEVTDLGSFSLSSVANASNGTTVYTGTFSNTNAFYPGTFAVIAGFSNSTNNGSYQVLSCTSTQLTLYNTTGIAETTSATATSSITFVSLPNPVADPPKLMPSQTIWTRRHYVKAAQSPLPQDAEHLQIKITFATEAIANEILGFGLA